MKNKYFINVAIWFAIFTLGNFILSLLLGTGGNVVARLIIAMIVAKLSPLYKRFE